MGDLYKLALTIGMLALCFPDHASGRVSIGDPEAIATIASDLAIPVDSVSGLARCVVARAEPGNKLAVFDKCIYARTPQSALLAKFDEQAGIYKLLWNLNVHSTRAVGLKKLGRAQQVQVHGKDTFIVFSLLSESPFGANAGTREAYEHLRSLGLDNAAPLQFVYEYRPIRVRVETR